MTENTSTALVKSPSVSPALARVSGQFAVTERLLTVKQVEPILIPYRKGDKWGYCDVKGNIKIPCVHDEVGCFERNGLAIFQEKYGHSSHYGLLNKQGQIILPAIYDYIGPCSEGLWCVWSKLNSQLKAVNENGVEIMQCQLEHFDHDTYETAFHDGLVKVGNLDGMYGYINLNGDLAIPYQFPHADDFCDGLAPVSEYFGDGEYGYGYIDKNGQWVIDPMYGSASKFSYGWGVLSTCCYVSKWGKVLDPFPTVRPFSDGMGNVQNGNCGEWGYIDITGKISIFSEFEAPSDFSEGLAPAKLNGKWGYIDKKGQVVIPYQFDFANEFKDGFAAVKFDGEYGDEYGVIDTTGGWAFYPGSFILKNIGDGIFQIIMDKHEGYVHAPTSSWFFFND